MWKVGVFVALGAAGTACCMGACRAALQLHVTVTVVLCCALVARMFAHTVTEWLRCMGGTAGVEFACLDRSWQQVAGWPRLTAWQ